MKCSEIKALLSEYLDNALDAQTKALVEEHLSACKVCSTELASLKAYIGQLHALQEVEAPGDFMEKVHARIKRRFDFEGIMHKLFVPARVKLPLELLAVTAVALLIVFVYRGMEPEIDIARVPAPVVPEPIVIAKMPAEEHIEARPEEMPAVKEEKPIELVLAVRREMPRISGGVFTESMAPLPAVGLLPGALEEVKNLIAGLQGEITDIMYDQETSLPQSITAEIPSGNYGEFLKKLAQIGSFQGPSPDELTLTATTVSVKIEFVLPK